MNRLHYEKSPYLLQHADNPVDWYPWGAGAFETARKTDRPVFLSIGYSTCHWCHVMAKESFEAEDVAAAVNRDFIAVKVDREERPDVDSVYMAACQAMNGSGGWPLTVLMTPDQKPFWAGTYLPKERLLSLLRSVSRLWRENRAALLTAGEEWTNLLRREDTTEDRFPDRALTEQAVRDFAEQFDVRWGGFGCAPKFPSAHNLLFLLRYAEATGDKNACTMAEITLERMEQGGIFDHVGGGFSRYSTDRHWLIPHFEKTLYDNALLALAYSESWRISRKPWQYRTACRTLDYILRELTHPEGGFFCGQDADSDGVEGKYYALTPEELTALLGSEDGERFCRRFQITPRWNFEGKSIPNLIGTPDWEQEPDGMDRLRETVAAYRRERTSLRCDDKVLTSWNGLAVAAFARAGQILEQPRYLTAASRAVNFWESHLTDAEGRLLTRWRDGEAAYSGRLDDYAFAAWGLLELYRATLIPAYLERICALSTWMLNLFFDDKQGGFYPYAADGEQLITRNKETFDGAMPSGNSAAALVLSRLERLTGEAAWRTAADRQFRYLAGRASTYPSGHSFSLLAFMEELWPAGELVCTSKEIQPEIFPFLREYPDMAVLYRTAENAERLSEIAPFTASYPIPESGARYYFCRNRRCEQPVDSLEELRRLIIQ